MKYWSNINGDFVELVAFTPPEFDNTYLYFKVYYKTRVKKVVGSKSVAVAKELMTSRRDFKYFDEAWMVENHPEYLI